LALRGGRILTSSPSQVALLRLTAGLQSLLGIAEKGEWDKIDELLQELLQTMETLRSKGFLDLTKPDVPEQIEHVLQLLHTASVVCSERKDQIAPLVNAFARSIGSAAKT